MTANVKHCRVPSWVICSFARKLFINLNNVLSISENIMHLPVTKPLCSWKACHVTNWSGSGSVIKLIMDSTAPLMYNDLRDLVLLILIQMTAKRRTLRFSTLRCICITIHHKHSLYPKQSHNMHNNTANPNAYTHQND